MYNENPSMGMFVDLNMTKIRGLRDCLKNPQIPLSAPSRLVSRIKSEHPSHHNLKG